MYVVICHPCELLICHGPGNHSNAVHVQIAHKVIVFFFVLPPTMMATLAMGPPFPALKQSKDLPINPESSLVQWFPMGITCNTAFPNLPSCGIQTTGTNSIDPMPTHAENTSSNHHDWGKPVHLAAICREIEERIACLNGLFSTLFPDKHCQNLLHDVVEVHSPAAEMTQQQLIMMTPMMMATPLPPKSQSSSPKTNSSTNLIPSLVTWACDAMMLMTMQLTTMSMPPMLPITQVPKPIKVNTGEWQPINLAAIWCEIECDMASFNQCLFMMTHISQQELQMPTTPSLMTMTVNDDDQQPVDLAAIQHEIKCDAGSFSKCLSMSPLTRPQTPPQSTISSPMTMTIVNSRTSNAEQWQESIKSFTSYLSTIDRIQQNFQLFCNPYTWLINNPVNINNSHLTYASTDIKLIDMSADRNNIWHQMQATSLSSPFPVSNMPLISPHPWCTLNRPSKTPIHPKPIIACNNLLVLCAKCESLYPFPQYLV